MKPQDLYTRKQANDGIIVPLLDKQGNPLADEWILVRGVDSDAYRAAHDGFNRTMVRLAGVVRDKGSAAVLTAETAAEKEAASLAERVALVADWSLEAPCTPEAAAELLREAPYVGDQVYAAAHDRDRFFGSSSATSTAGPNTSSVLESPQQQGQHTR